MKPLLKVVLTLGVFFTSMLVVAKLAGLLDLARLQSVLETLQAEGAPWWIGAIVAGLLFADLFLAVPTLEVSLLAGHVLGFGSAFASTLLGSTAAGLAGYTLCRWRGESFVRVILRDAGERDELRTTFERYGVPMILVSRALPVLPEVSACLAGATGMPLRRFLLAWLSVNVPYMAIASYAGSVSTWSDPFPAIAAAVGLTVLFWAGWWALQRRSRSTVGPDAVRGINAPRGG